MGLQRLSRLDLVLLVSVLVAVPMAVIVVQNGGYSLVTLALVVSVASLFTLLIQGETAAEREAQIARPLAVAAESVVLTAAQPQGVEMLDRLPPPPEPVLVCVVGARGFCPLGFHPGTAWAISEQGQLSSPLCRPAVEAVSAVIRQWPTQGPEPITACHCSLVSPPPSLSFVVLSQTGVAEARYG